MKKRGHKRHKSCSQWELLGEQRRDIGAKQRFCTICSLATDKIRFKGAISATRNSAGIARPLEAAQIRSGSRLLKHL